RVLAESPAEVELEPLAQRTHAPGVDATAHPGEVGHHLAAGQASELGHVAGYVTHPALDVDRVARAVQAEDVGRAAGRPDHPHEQADRGRLAGAVRPEVAEDLLGRDLEVQVEDASAGAVILGELGCPD